jgi:hypothetical protein
VARFFPAAPLSAFVVVTIEGAFADGWTFGSLEFAFHVKVIKPVLLRFFSGMLANIHPEDTSKV